MEKSTVVLTTSYFPPIQYFSKLINYQKVLIDVNETYTKQSYRNRCVVLSCNGPLSLIVPVIKPNGNHTLTKDIQIDYSTNWQKNHRKAIESAYRNSVYFDFIEDHIIPFFERREHFLYDLNNKIIIELLTFLGFNKTIEFTDQFLPSYPSGYEDYRFSIHPKQQYSAYDPNFDMKVYYQVFSDKFPFVSNLSILDLLFNEGLTSVDLLEKK